MLSSKSVQTKNEKKNRFKGNWHHCIWFSYKVMSVLIDDWLGLIEK